MQRFGVKVINSRLRVRQILVTDSQTYLQTLAVYDVCHASVKKSVDGNTKPEYSYKGRHFEKITFPRLME